MDAGETMTARADRQLAKLYESMTSREKGTVAFAALARLDKAEVARIETTVPWKTYRMRDCEYDDRIDRLGHLAFFWGLQHWRLQAALAAGLGLIDKACSSDNAELCARAVRMFLEAQGRMIALDRILVEVCEAAGVGVDAVRAVACTPERSELTDLPFGEPVRDPEYEADIRNTLMPLTG